MKKKTLIGILASHDDPEVNRALAEVLAQAYQRDPKKFDLFHFLFTGGTFNRVILGQGNNAYQIPDQNALAAVRKNSTRLPEYAKGGVTILANFVVQRQCSIVITFLSPQTTHWLNPENLALMRLCDTLKVRRFLNAGSVKTWFFHEVTAHYKLNPQDIPPKLVFGTSGCPSPLPTQPCQAQVQLGRDYAEIPDPQLALVQGPWDEVNFVAIAALGRNAFVDRTIALIAHDHMKAAMVNFAVEYEHELGQFRRILTTEATGQAVQQAARSLKSKICLCRSGPLGGDIEIATEVLYGQCDVVIFFLDPRSPHPHIEDIRTLFAACMRTKDVLMFTNEEHARDWMKNVVRPNC